MFERFNESAIKVIMLAQEEARRMGHNFVGTEQILLGLIGEGRGVAATALKKSNVSLNDARIEVEKIIGRGDGKIAIEIPFTVNAKQLLQLSWQEATGLGQKHIGTEHLLLGLIRQKKCVACRVLEALSVDMLRLHAQIITLLKGTNLASDTLPLELDSSIFPSNKANLVEEPFKRYWILIIISISVAAIAAWCSYLLFKK